METKTHTRFGRYLRKVTATATLATAVGLGLSVIAAPPASAYVSTPSGGSAIAYFSCDDRINWLSYGVTVYPEAGRASQSIKFRFYSEDVSSRTGGWTVWHSGVTGPYPGQPYGYDNILIAPESLSRIYVEYGWWSSTGWRFSGEWITQYRQLGWYNGVYNGMFRYCDL